MSKKKAKWIRLGHRHETLSHPYAVYYECSECGYVRYTLWSYPPEVCPNCRFDMEEVDDSNR